MIAKSSVQVLTLSYEREHGKPRGLGSYIFSFRSSKMGQKTFTKEYGVMMYSKAKAQAIADAASMDCLIIKLLS